MKVDNPKRYCHINKKGFKINADGDFIKYKEHLIIANELLRQQLILPFVIKWFATKDQKPVNKQMVMMFYKKTLMICGYKSPCWEDFKPEYWASIDKIKQPCL